MASLLASVFCFQAWGAPAPQPNADVVQRLNARAIEQFEHERAAGIDGRYWVVVVPGTTEQWGHHKAPPRSLDPDGRLISDEFRQRLAHAAELLGAGAARFILVSGGAIDPERPDYVEANRGAAFLESDPALADHVFVEPFAQHTMSNMRNSDKLVTALGLTRDLIETTMPRDCLDFSAEGWFYAHHALSGFDLLALLQYGYTLGGFHERSFVAPNGELVTAIVHTHLRAAQLANTDYAP